MAGPVTEAASALPALREDLSIFKGPVSSSGAPTWTLHDPPSNRFFRIGWMEFEILSRWRPGETAASLARAVSAQTTLSVRANTIDAFVKFLSRNNLVQITGAGQVRRLRMLKEERRPSVALRILRSHLFFRLPLIRPDSLLAILQPVANVFYSKGFLTMTVVAAFLGVYLAARQWDLFIETIVTLFDWSSVALIVFTVVVVKILHEFGHALTARRFGCHVPTMGVAFMVLWPVLYTDTTDAWRLTSKAQRLAISGAGIGVELIIAAYATLAWSFLPSGPLQSAAFLIATTTWILSILVNLNPLMRFDGYFLFSDIMEVENIQERAFMLAKWRLREALFGFNDPPPENWPPGKRRILLLYAYLTWAYRAALYLGIALLIYHFLFKLAGLILFFLEIGWLIGLPIVREMKYIYQRLGDLSLNRRIVTTLILFAAIVYALVTPWAADVTVPALLRPVSHSVVYAPTAARLETMTVNLGDRVEAGATLARLRSTDLDNLINVARTEVAVLEWRRAFETFDAARRQFRLVVEGKLRAARAKLAGHLEKRKALDITAPIAGKIVEISEDLRAGNWLAEGEPMLIVAQTEQSMIEAYVPEGELKRVKIGAAVTFHPENLDEKQISGRVETIDPIAVAYMDNAYLASKYGGGVAVRETENNRFSPREAHYLVRISIASSEGGLPRISRGDAAIKAPKKNLLARARSVIVAVVIRESGF